MRLFTGILSGLDGHFVLAGDSSVNSRPMGRITVPLRMMGASIDGRAGGAFPPVSIRGGDLEGVTYATPVASAQIKSAVLLAGLSATGVTTVQEHVLTRPHTEEFLKLTGASMQQHTTRDGTYSVSVKQTPQLNAFDVAIPKDPSQCAFWLVIAAIAPESKVEIPGMYYGATRDGFLQALIDMGAQVTIDLDNEVGGTQSATGSSTVFPTATVSVQTSELKAVQIRGARVASMIDEIPILVAAAAFAEGTSEFLDLGELRVKESDRIATTTEMMRRFGADVHNGNDSIVVKGSRSFRPRAASIDSRGDHRIAMVAALLGSMAEGETEISGFDGVQSSYPGFLEDLQKLEQGRR